MSIRLVLVILLMSVAFQGFAQDCAYDNYYQYITEAKNFVLKKKYKDARDKFKQAFSIEVFPLGRDLDSALLVAAKLKDVEWAYVLSVQLAKGGIPLSYFIKFRKYKWYKKFQESFNDYTTYHYENFDCDLKQKLLDIRKHDISHNKLIHSLREGNCECTFEEIVNSANKLVTNFNQMCIDFYFPTEERMGYYFAKNKIEDYPTGVILIHVFQNGVLLFYEKLKNLACEGIISNEYAETLENIRGFGDSTGVEQEIKIRFKKYQFCPKRF